MGVVVIVLVGEVAGFSVMGWPLVEVVASVEDELSVEVGSTAVDVTMGAELAPEVGTGATVDTVVLVSALIREEQARSTKMDMVPLISIVVSLGFTEFGMNDLYL